MKPPTFAALTRRTFLTRTTQSAGLLALAGLKPLTSLATTPAFSKTMTVQQIIDLILKAGELSRMKNTVDTLKSGQRQSGSNGHRDHHVSDHHGH